MTAVVVAEAVAIGLLTVLVAGLLRTQGRIVAVLRQGGPAGMTSAPRPTGSVEVAGRAAPDLCGVDLDGRPARLATQARSVLAFLTSGCTSCGWWWQQLGATAGHTFVADLVAVTPDPGTDAPEDVRPLAGGLRVLMSSEAWEAYGVRAGSTFVIVEGGTVRAGGCAATWDELMALVAAAGASERER